MRAPGRVTVGAAKVHTLGDPNAVTVDGFCGNFSHVGGKFADPDTWDPFVVGHPNPAWYNITQSGPDPVDIVILGDSFGNGPPGVTLGGGKAKYYSVNNALWFHMDKHELNTLTVPDQLEPHGLARASAAWDHFRRLGAVDLALNYPSVLRQD